MKKELLGETSKFTEECVQNEFSGKYSIPVGNIFFLNFFDPSIDRNASKKFPPNSKVQSAIFSPTPGNLSSFFASGNFFAE